MGILPVDVGGVRRLLDFELLALERREPRGTPAEPPQSHLLLIPPRHHRPHIRLVPERNNRETRPTNWAFPLGLGFAHGLDLFDDLVLFILQLDHLGLRLEPGHHLLVGLQHLAGVITLPVLLEVQDQIRPNLHQLIPQLCKLFNAVSNRHLDHLHRLPRQPVFLEKLFDLVLLVGTLRKPYHLDSVIIRHGGVVVHVVA
mmetsp:Transcript_9191/g.23152  ORF Transcript_9191/g.23152 Transcript_9191/m.23152 type:complete len:200 (-) Transcript_9191:541-1140(-)